MNGAYAVVSNMHKQYLNNVSSQQYDEKLN